MSQENGEFLRHAPCPDCQSTDSLALYSNGTGYCWGKCDSEGDGFKSQSKLEGRENDVFIKPTKKNMKLVEDLEYNILTKRGKISAKICKKYGYGYGKYKFSGKVMLSQIANYHNDKGQVIAQKIRNANKDFVFIGEGTSTLLWGKHLWRNKGGKKIVVTEGEIDTLSVAEAYEGKYPVVSLPTGANSVKKALLANYEWLESFDQIVIWFDSDEAGIKAQEACKEIFSAEKLWFVPNDSNYKDANEVLVNEGRQAVISKIYEAKQHEEESVIKGEDIEFETLRQDIKKGRELPYPKLQDMTMGTRGSELWIWTAGSGIGKSTMVTEIGKYQLDKDSSMRLGVIYLEESVNKTADRFMALDHNVSLKELRINHSLITDEQAYETYTKYFKNNRINFYKHFGSMGTSKLLNKIRYMVKSLGCNTFILDHISIVVSGTSSDEGERKQLDIFMTELRTLIEELGISIHAIVHLKRVSGKKSFNEGGAISLSDLRGSASLEQLSDAVIALERDQQDEKLPTLAKIRVLKCRETGDTGVADSVNYNKLNGRYELYTDEEIDDETF